MCASLCIAASAAIATTLVVYCLRVYQSWFKSIAARFSPQLKGALPGSTTGANS